MTEAFKLELHTYLVRLGYSSAPPPTLDTLRELHALRIAQGGRSTWFCPVCQK